ncbi:MULTISPECIES: RES family NAD+ phosphorylase [Paenibacillus]|uniref:RES domain-containing protein n=1 Tax=Paenibacillus borealis TaxID=160799 RepID=A0ABX3H3Y8_PAEBO|nr:RES family NAD+ phosphorylase [Paenibacillus borealis]OMD45088.1 hypothetical protein BSK56_21085 [Paenibacillus borealis]
MDLQKYIEDSFESCEECNEEYINFLEEQNEDFPTEICFEVWRLLEELDIPLEEWKKIDAKCPMCEEFLMLSTILIRNTSEFEKWTEDKAVELLSDEVYECQACNSGEIPSTQKYGDPFDLKIISDLYSEFGVPNSLEEKIEGRIRCNCGEALDYDQPYVTENNVKIWYGDDLEADFTEQIINTFLVSSDDATVFTRLLINYPMMALEHDVGRKIYEAFLNKSVKGLITLSQGTILYRGRKRNVIERHVPFVESELWAPPEGIPGQGRYNPSGVPVLYLTDNKSTALKEIDLQNGEAAEIGQFVTLASLTIWDLENLDIDEFVSLPSLNRGSISKEYVFPNFLAQCAGKAGINGIKYNSVKDKNGNNIALLNYKRDYNLHLLSKKIETIDYSVMLR